MRAIRREGTKLQRNGGSIQRVLEESRQKNKGHKDIKLVLKHQRQQSLLCRKWQGNWEYIEGHTLFLFF